VISGEKIAALIHAPHTVEANNLHELKDLVNQYPFCSSLRLLHLKGLALNHDLNFEHELAQTAIHAADRTHLYALIHTATEENKGSFEEQKKEESYPEIKEEQVPIVTEDVPLVEQEIERDAQLEAEIEGVIIPLNEASRVLKIEIEEEDDNDDDELDSRLDDDILTHAIDIAFVDSGIDKAKIETKADEREDETVESETSAYTAVAETSLKAELKKEKQEDEAESIEPLSFVDWLKKKQSQPILSVKEIEPIAEVEKEFVQQKGSVNELLEKFINEQPTISRPVKDFYNPVRNARESIEESDDMVTETLAKIYAIQKNYSKAIAAYEKLILLYPEKKTFFASRIENLREEQKKR